MATAHDRITAFEHHFARAQATRIIDLDWGFAHLQRDFPLSYAHNGLVVTDDASPSDILAIAEEIFGEAGLAHRSISFDDDTAGQAAIPDFLAAGYEHEALIAMIHDGSDLGSPDHEVLEVSVQQIRPVLARDWRLDLPAATSEEIDQLADRVSLYSKAAETTFLAAFDSDEVGARADVFIDRENGIAQFESLVTHPDFRRRGFGGALICEAHQRISRAGCDLSYLIADNGDWPKDWYGRLGYTESHRTHEFTRL